MTERPSYRLAAVLARWLAQPGAEALLLPVVGGVLQLVQVIMTWSSWATT
jgi:hypothetical protein